MRIVQISDTHISHLGGVTSENFERIAEFVNTALRPDLVVNSGDVSILSPDVTEDRETAAKLHQAFDAPVRVLPGNHDLGEVGEHAWMGIRVTSERIANFVSTFGSDRFLEFVGDDWAIIGLNSEVLGSGLPEEADQWTWLESVASQVEGRNLVFFLHKPFWSPAPEFTEHALAIEPSDRDRILGLFAKSTVKAVGSGHLHNYRRKVEEDILTVWGPSSAFIVHSLPATWGGLAQIGVVEYVIEGDTIESYFRAIPTVTEEEPFEMPAFKETMALIEAAAV
jgi:3',5'-cyclic AMP phosphodiesterase CpdA